jgi:glycosyltransferase involved in cell wall biosynthesis
LQKSPGTARFAFLSRLTRKKNLHYFLERLRKVKQGRVEVDVIGPLEDPAYSKECMSIANELTDNISVRFLGPFSNHEALKIVFDSHFFVLPTLNENFGYVMLEALAVGCPLLISDKTIWNNVIDENAGWAIPLESKAEWIETINRCVAMDQHEYRKMSENAVHFANTWISDPSAENAMAEIVDHALVKTCVNKADMTFA